MTLLSRATIGIPIFSTIFFLLLIAPSMGAPCQSCVNISDISVHGISLQNIDPSDLSAFKDLDPREIGRAMDISGYTHSDLDQIRDIIGTDQDNPTDGGDAAVMNLQTDVVLAMQEANLNLARFTVPENLTSIPPGSFSHLNRFVYIPSEWDQTGGTDEHCGNCWVWADTGALQLDLAYQKNVTDRLSVQ
ncbi:MAG: hypothetical protein CVV33_10480, partial [Methanomicrobiales archaeon HGW-Methanomicrobiales-4]